MTADGYRRCCAGRPGGISPRAADFLGALQAATRTTPGSLTKSGIYDNSLTRIFSKIIGGYRTPSKANIQQVRISVYSGVPGAELVRNAEVLYETRLKTGLQACQPCWHLRKAATDSCTREYRFSFDSLGLHGPAQKKSLQAGLENIRLHDSRLCDRISGRIFSTEGRTTAKWSPEIRPRLGPSTGPAVPVLPSLACATRATHSRPSKPDPVVRQPSGSGRMSILAFVWTQKEGPFHE